jgi:ATP-dependent RNA helicase RhlE
MLQRLMGVRLGSSRTVRALIIVPTRELAVQVARSVRTYGAHLPLRCSVVSGGVGMHPQLESLRRQNVFFSATFPDKLKLLFGQCRTGPPLVTESMSSICRRRHLFAAPKVFHHAT